MDYSENWWFNIQLGANRNGRYAQWCNLVLLKDGKILWQGFDKDCNEIWSSEPTNIGFDYKDEVVQYVRDNHEKVVQAVLESLETRESVPLTGKFSVWCHGHYGDGGELIEE